MTIFDATRELPGRTSAVGKVLRQVGVSLIFGKTKDYHLDDRGSVDGTGASNMATAIGAYLSEAATAGFKRVYSEAGKTYLLNSQVDIPQSVVWEGPAQVNAAGGNTALFATIKAGAGSITLLRLAGAYAGLRGFAIDLDSKASAVGLRPNAAYQVVDDCWFTNIASTSTAIRGGGLLYPAIRRCLFNGVSGRAIDLLNAYGDNSGSTYYGANAGVIEQCWFYGPGGMIRLDGVATIRDCDFEGAYAGSTGVIDLGGSLNAHVAIEDCYAELSGSGTHLVWIYLQSASVLLKAQHNVAYGQSSALAGSAAIEFGGYAPQFDIQGNEFYRWETGIKNVRPASDSSIAIGNNYFSSVGTKITYNSIMTTKIVTGSPVGFGTIADPDFGLRVYGMAVNGTVVYHSNPTTQLVIDLSKGNVFHLAYSGSATPTQINKTPGMRFTLYFETGNTTLTNATWHPKEGANTLMAAGTSRDFFVDYLGAIREVTG